MRIGLLVVTVLALTGCGGGATSGPGTAQAVPSAPAAATPAAKPMTAGQVLAALKKAGVPITKVIVFNADNDPNGALGRPGKYVSKAACVDPRVKKADRGERGSIDNGCGVEVFKTERQAKARAAYVAGLMENMPLLGSEYHVVKGPVLLRVTGHLTPKQARAYKAPFLALPL